MTKFEDSQRVKGNRSETTYESRFPRYAANALTEAGFAEGRRNGTRRSAYFSRQAAKNARDHGDEAAAELYDEIADAQDEIADAQDDIAGAHHDLAAHYGKGQENA